MSIDGREFARTIMTRYRVKPAAAAAILAHCDVEVLDWSNTTGGGIVYPAGPQRWLVQLAGVQHEAALHEAAHVWWYLYQDDSLVAMLIDMMFVQSELTHMARWKPFRQLMATYRWGDGHGWAGMWVESASRWNHDEVWAGGASFSMGDVTLYPPMAIRLYERMFLAREMIWLPIMRG